MNTTDVLASALLQLGSVTAATWGMAQALSALHPKLNGIRVAMLAGPTLATLAYTFGYLPVILEIVPEGGARAYGSAAFAGLIATLCAKFFNDMIFNKLRDLIAKKGSGSD